MNIFETEYSQYLAAKKAGVRRKAFEYLKCFLSRCDSLDTARLREVVKDFFNRQSREDIKAAFALPLNSELLFPILQAWCKENPAESWIWRSFAELACYQEHLTDEQGKSLAIAENAPLDDLPVRKALCRALELEPTDYIAWTMYIESLLETLKLLIHDQAAGDVSATPLIAEEINKIAEQLAMLPTNPEKSYLTEEFKQLCLEIKPYY
jgi:hypothetical protein